MVAAAVTASAAADVVAIFIACESGDGGDDGNVTMLMWQNAMLILKCGGDGGTTICASHFSLHL